MGVRAFWLCSRRSVCAVQYGIVRVIAGGVVGGVEQLIGTTTGFGHGACRGVGLCGWCLCVWLVGCWWRVSCCMCGCAYWYSVHQMWNLQRYGVDIVWVGGRYLHRRVFASIVCVLTNSVVIAPQFSRNVVVVA